VPREHLDLPCNHEFYRFFEDKGILTLFNITQPQSIDTYKLIQCIRNSVAHALFSIEQTNGVIYYDFWTERDPIFKARTTHHNLKEFIEIVGVKLINAVLSQKLSFGNADDRNF
jgi:hypothetical protein